MTRKSVWIGFDPREAAAFAVARHSILKNCSDPKIEVRGLVLDHLKRAGLFWRDQPKVDGKIYDTISEAFCATEFSISRFAVPFVAEGDWALFIDCDMMFRGDVAALFDACDPSKAVMVVKHLHEPAEGVKMDAQVQTRYARKNWSSTACFNLRHEANKRLTIEMVNSLPGRDLHAFSWLEDEEIGDLGVEWNWLAGHSDPAVDPVNVHWTDGIPLMQGYEDAPYASEFFDVLHDWAAGE